MKTLDDLKLRKNTLIVFMGDNGTASQYADRGTIGGKKLSGKKVSKKQQKKATKFNKSEIKNDDD